MSRDQNQQWKRWLWLVPLLLFIAILVVPRTKKTPVADVNPAAETNASLAVQRRVQEELGTRPRWVELGRPLPGRPEAELPIPRSVFSDVTLSIDGQPAGAEPLRFHAGQTVTIAGQIKGQPELPANVILDAGVGLVSRSDNEAGWVITNCAFTGDGSTKNRTRDFTIRYTFPETPGEFVLVTHSSATVGVPDEIPILLAGQHDVVLE